MAVVVPYRERVYQVPNAFASFWASWVDTRGELNQYVLKSRIALLSPDDRHRDMLELQKRITGLQKLTAEVLNEGAKAKNEQVQANIEGAWKKNTADSAVWSAIARGDREIIKARIAAAADVTIQAMKLQEEARKDLPGDQTRQLVRALVSTLAGSSGTIPASPADAAEQKWQAALAAEKAGATSSKADKVTFEFLMGLDAEAERAPDEATRARLEQARDNIAQRHFGTTKLPSVLRTMEERYGPMTGAALQETIRNVTRFGAGSEAPPGVSVRYGTSTGTRGPAAPTTEAMGATGGMAPPPQGVAGVADITGVPGAAPPTTGATPDATDPLALALGLTQEIDARIADAKRELMALEASQRAQREARAKAGPFPGFTRNVITEPLMAQPGGLPQQRLVQLASEVDPMRLRIIMDELELARGDPAKALEKIRAEGGLPAQAPRIQAIADPGQMVGAWFDDTLAAAMGGAASDEPQRQAEALRLIAELAQAAENNSDTLKVRAPGLSDWLATSVESASVGTPYLAALGKAREAAQAMRADDLHFSELMGDSAGVVLNARTPEEKIAAASWFADWSSKNPPSLAGQWSEVAPRVVGGALKEGRGKDLLRDVQNMRSAAYVFADTEPEKAARRAALETRTEEPSWSEVSAAPMTAAEQAAHALRIRRAPDAPRRTRKDVEAEPVPERSMIPQVPTTLVPGADPWQLAEQAAWDARIEALRAAETP